MRFSLDIIPLFLQHNMTALIWAAGRGHTNVVRELLESGARAEISDKVFKIFSHFIAHIAFYRG